VRYASNRPFLFTLLGATALLSVIGFMALRSPSVSVGAGFVKLTTIGSFDGPLAVVQPPGDNHRLLVVEHTGRAKVLVDGKAQITPFIDLSTQVSCCGERGLLGFAFAPDYATSGLFYVDFTDTNGDTRIYEYHRSATSANRADPSSGRLVLTQAQPEPNHNGGQILFGADKMLYIGLGDGGSAYDPHGVFGNGQNLGTWLGKILRINPKQSGSDPYTVPASNPFVGRPGAKPEIWAYGLRNPWRFSFDRRSGGLVIGDVGQDTREEVDWSPAPTSGRGLNFGWRVWEGTRAMFPHETASGPVFPVAEYKHRAGACSITGGYVIRDTRLKRIYGRYIYGDFCTGQISTLGLRAGRLAAVTYGARSIKVAQLSSFGQDNSGRLYLTSLSGRVYRLDPA